MIKSKDLTKNAALEQYQTYLDYKSKLQEKIQTLGPKPTCHELYQILELRD